MNNPKHQIQITDLLANAVTNATERRSLAEITELSDDASQDIRGGIGIGIGIGLGTPKICKPIICGILIYPELPNLDSSARF